MHHLFPNEGGWVKPETRDDSARSSCLTVVAVVVFGLPALAKQPEGEKELVARVLQAATGQ